MVATSQTDQRLEAARKFMRTLRSALAEFEATFEPSPIAVRPKAPIVSVERGPAPRGARIRTKKQARAKRPMKFAIFASTAQNPERIYICGEGSEQYRDLLKDSRMLWPQLTTLGDITRFIFCEQGRKQLGLTLTASMSGREIVTELSRYAQRHGLTLMALADRLVTAGVEDALDRYAK